MRITSVIVATAVLDVACGSRPSKPQEPVMVGGQSAIMKDAVVVQADLDPFETAINSQIAGDASVQVMLKQDRQVVNGVREAVDFKAAKMYPVDRRASLLGWAWFWLRLGNNAVPTSQPLTAQAVLARSDDMGTLTIESTPQGAEIRVDTIQVGHTNRWLYADEGERLVQISMPGLEAVRRRCRVASYQNTIFIATLLKSGSTATCGAPRR